MIWDTIKKIILSGMISWVGFVIITIFRGFKAKDRLSNLLQSFIEIKDLAEVNKWTIEYNKAEDKLFLWNIFLWISIFILLTFIILFF